MMVNNLRYYLYIFLCCFNFQPHLSPNQLNVQVSFLSLWYFPCLTGGSLFITHDHWHVSFYTIVYYIDFSLLPQLCYHHDAKCSSTGLRLIFSRSWQQNKFWLLCAGNH